MKFELANIRAFHDGLLRKDFSAEEAAKECFKEIKADKKVNPFLSLDEGDALSAASEVDEMIARGEEIGILAGVPMGIKDNILVRGKRTTAGSKILMEYTGGYDATVVEKLKHSRAVILGKTNLDEFAMGSSTENSAFQKTANPHDPERVPGGSSGGSAAAVAGGFALGALGSDTGGSIRQPAAFCGVSGLKPTYGSVSRFGLIALASSLDQIGPFARTAEDAAIIFDAIRGHDELDSTSVPGEYGSTAEYDAERVRSLTLGVPKEYFGEGIDPDVAAAVRDAIGVFERKGFLVKEISLPHSKYALSCYYIILPAEASANLARFDGIRYGRNSEKNSLREVYEETRGRGFGDEVKRRVLLGTFVLSSGYYDAYYAKAQKVRGLIVRDFEESFDGNSGGVDAILAPVTPTRAFAMGEKTSDPLTMYLSDMFTIPANLASLPALSLPVKEYKLGSGELPIGFQIIGKPFHEKDILGLGMWYEKETR